MRELLSNNSLFVSQLYEDKSLALRACDLIFFTTDLQNSELLELSYFLNKHCLLDTPAKYWSIKRSTIKHTHILYIYSKESLPDHQTLKEKET